MKEETQIIKEYVKNNKLSKEYKKEIDNIIDKHKDEDNNELDIIQNLLFYLQNRALKYCESDKLTEIQKDSILKICPCCERGKLHPVEGEEENYLWCDTCDLSMDSNGGYIN